MLAALVPKAIQWAEEQARKHAPLGEPLSPVLLYITRRVGVSRPELIRLVWVDSLPMPDDPELQQAAFASGMYSPEMVGLTLGYCVFICRGHGSNQLLSHEFRHVQQYEQAGSIAAFLPAYLEQVLTLGYWDAPLEVDARAHEFG